jgi:methylated-DNA-[protein]-cysteine S-methyltransferase/AraC family transcriptional regulator of adaptative response/methylated-DNA-[protein]-cysteine methyltransferase
MNLMMTKDTLRTAPKRDAAATLTDFLSFIVANSSFGKVLIARSVTGVCAILLGDDGDELVTDLAKRFPQSTLVPGGSAALKGDLAKVLRYIERPAEGLHLTVDMRGTPFQRRVWEKLKAISVGRTISYTELAHLISPLANPRAVANACAANPIALAIPCHRVVRSNGDLAGFRWGLERKRALIQKEAMA